MAAESDYGCGGGAGNRIGKNRLCCHNHPRPISPAYALIRNIRVISASVIVEVVLKWLSQLTGFSEGEARSGNRFQTLPGFIKRFLCQSFEHVIIFLVVPSRY